MSSNFRYLLIGSGRTALHFSRYFQLLGLPYSQWNRHLPSNRLQDELKQATHVLLLISDSAIESFYQTHLRSYSGRVLHFSGALQVAGILDVHPLMTFGREVYDLETYQTIPFVTSSQENLASLLPGLSNPLSKISPNQKPYYHALCVMSGNFTTLLWQKMAEGMQQLGLPSGIEATYRQQIFRNLQQDLSHALTGPLARKDLTTIVRNDQSLAEDPYQKIYRAFVAVHFPEALSHLKGVP